MLVRGMVIFVSAVLHMKHTDFALLVNYTKKNSDFAFLQLTVIYALTVQLTQSLVHTEREKRKSKRPGKTKL